MRSFLSIIRFILKIISRNLQFPKYYCGKTVQMEDGLKLKIFRHMKDISKNPAENGSILIIRFQFNKFSHSTNIKASKIPIPLIGGFKGFGDKLWMIDWENGYWQGIYQWDNEITIERYKKSFVLNIMNKRAEESSISYNILPDINFEEYINKLVID